VPRTEAAKNRYYDLPKDLVGDFQPEKLIGYLESRAAIAIGRLEQRQLLLPDDVVHLAYFAALQSVRTPLDRAERRHLDEIMASQLAQLRFSAQDQAVAFLRAHDPDLTVEQAEQRRKQIVQDLESGHIQVQSNAHREIAGMFLALNESVGEIAMNCNWTLVEFSAPGIVLPDSGYTRYDPSPSVPGSGSGFLGSESVETVIPVSPTAVLLITRGNGEVHYRRGTPAYLEDLNLRAYSQSERCIYGRTQQSVVDVHLRAKKNRAAVFERRRRPRTLWIGEGAEGKRMGGLVLFTGYSIEGIRKQRFHVGPRGTLGKGVRAEDMWQE
jgi:hypothetical protein